MKTMALMLGLTGSALVAALAQANDYTFAGTTYGAR